MPQTRIKHRRKPNRDTRPRKRMSLEPLEDRRLLTTITVNTAADIVDVDSAALIADLPGLDGVISLREAVIATNNSPGADSIDFDTSGVFSVPQSIGIGVSGQLTITDAVSILGPGPDQLTIDAQNLSALLLIDDSQSSLQLVQLSGLTLTNALSTYSPISSAEHLAISNCHITDNRGLDITAGAIWQTAGNLTVQESVVSGNEGFVSAIFSQSTGSVVVNETEVSSNRTHYYAGGLTAAAANATALVSNSRIFNNVATGSTAGSGGGGIFTVAQMSIIDSEISNNSTPDSGGGVYSANALTITRSTISGNSSGAKGGGVYGNGFLSVSRSQIVGNHADGGGGIYARGDLTISETSISENSAIGAVGGVISQYGGELEITSSTVSGNSAGANIGGIYSNGRTTITNSTISNNETTANVGGMTIYGSHPSLISNVTVSGNTATGTFGGAFLCNATLQHSTITDNSDGNGIDGVRFSSCGGGVTAFSNIISGNAGTDISLGNDFASGGYNIVGSGDTGPFTATGDQTGVSDPGLKSLAYNGGPTKTHALLPTSPALNLGATPQGATSDQRGPLFARNDGLGVDAGAFELQSSPVQPLIVDTVADERNGNYSSGDLSLREAIDLANGSAAAQTITFDSPGLFSSPQTITLELGELQISGNMSIDGDTANQLVIDANGNSRAIFVDDGSVAQTSIVEFAGFTITGGNAFGTGVQQRSGGGIRNLEQLTLNSINIHDNLAEVGGGGVFNLGTLDVVDSTISGNQAIFGGGISNYYGVLNVTGSSVSNNSAATAGGGIYTYQGPLTVSNSTIASNTAASGGGVSSWDTAASDSLITNSTISGNTASQLGGGLYHRYGSLQIRYSTITENVAPIAFGSGIFLDTNFSSDLLLAGSIVAGNADSDIRHETFFINRISSEGFNLIGASDELSGFVGSDLTGVMNPQLGPLANNGGPTLTHDLLAASPAKNAGNPGFTGSLLFDQRGNPFARVADGRIDIGAVESQSAIVDGDFNDDGLYDCVDVNSLSAEIAAGTHAVGFDLTHDGSVDGADLMAWLLEAGEANLGPGLAYLAADANLSGNVDGADFLIWNTGKFTSSDAFCAGDFDANGNVDGSDFLIWNNLKFSSSDMVLAAVTGTSAPGQGELSELSVRKMISRPSTANLGQLQAATRPRTYKAPSSTRWTQPLRNSLDDNLETTSNRNVDICDCLFSELSSSMTGAVITARSLEYPTARRHDDT